MQTTESLTIEDLRSLKLESFKLISEAFRRSIAEGTILKLVDGEWLDVNGNVVKKNEKKL